MPTAAMLEGAPGWVRSRSFLSGNNRRWRGGDLQAWPGRHCPADWRGRVPFPKPKVRGRPTRYRLIEENRDDSWSVRRKIASRLCSFSESVVICTRKIGHGLVHVANT